MTSLLRKFLLVLGAWLAMVAVWGWYVGIWP